MNNSFLGTMIFTLALSSVFSQNQEDMVLISATATESSFYIDIFETTHLQARAKGISSLSTGDKPAKLGDPEDAKEYCEKMGRQLPTQSEWGRAASLNGKNKNFTLRDDSLKHHIQNKTVNYGHGSDSLSVYNFEELGIDISGTVGMTGNMGEWVFNHLTGHYCKCGGDYSGYEASEVMINNACTCKSWWYGYEYGTARCVFKKKNNVSYSINVYGELEKYLNFLALVPPTIVPAPIVTPEPEPEADIDHDDLDLDDDESDFD